MTRQEAFHRKFAGRAVRGIRRPCRQTSFGCPCPARHRIFSLPSTPLPVPPYISFAVLPADTKIRTKKLPTGLPCRQKQFCCIFMVPRYVFFCPSPIRSETIPTFAGLYSCTSNGKKSARLLPQAPFGSPQNNPRFHRSSHMPAKEATKQISHLHTVPSHRSPPSFETASA